MATRILFFLCFIITAPVAAQPAELFAEWETKEIAPGVIWKSYQGESYFDSPQSINVIAVDLSADVEFSFAHGDTVLTRTSTFGTENDALAAINGSFFSFETGKSVTFFKLNDDVITRGAVDRRLYSESGGVGVDSNGGLSIIQRPEDGWLSHAGVESVLGSGPLLILEGEFRTLNEDPFNQNRHPRTAVGITEGDRVYLVTVDGRHERAEGMSTPELAEFLERKQSHYGINLDGGGSTTMWISGEVESGVVNYPSGNGEFDHDGERPVANVLLLKLK